MYKGTIKVFEKGFGYIQREGQRDLFFHKNDCIGWLPNIGGTCEFDIGPGRDGRPSAKNVRRLQTANPPQSNNAATPAAAQQGPQSQTQKTDDLPNPYHFAYIDLDLAITDAPVWHDGSGADAKQRRTGKLRVSLRTLTPLLVGWTQYELSEADKKLRVGDQEKIFLGGMDKEKKILEPLRLADGKVAVPGKSLNGMIRHSLGALLEAPMERVAERVYSYRPALAPSKERDRLQLLPAIITAWNGDKLKIKVLPNAHCVCFSESCFERNDFKYKSKIGESQSLIDADIKIIPSKKPKVPDKHHLVERMGHTLKDEFCLFNYLGGIDTCGELYEYFQKKRRNEKEGNPRQGNIMPVHKYAAVKAGTYANETQDSEISDDCIQHYIASLEQLKDSEKGHLTKGHPLLHGEENSKVDIGNIQGKLAEQIHRWANKSPDLKNQLIYIEIQRKDDGTFGPIRSFGHNFQYRTRYVDSVRLQGKDKQVRKILKPLSRETTDDDDGTPPSTLSGARLFCGYVSRRETGEVWHEQGSDNIGSGKYLRLKGRIGCGFAVEQVDAEKPHDIDRFLSRKDNGQFLIPLKPLGMPRPSAVEHYLRQPKAETIGAKRHDGAGLLTYGDLPEVPGGVADEPGELAGRKFYRHQPDAAQDESCYTDTDPEHLKGHQAALGRYISQSETLFHFTLDFQDLRDWELGALLVTAFPHLCLPPLVAALAEKAPAFAALNAKLDALNRLACENQHPALAHKLGHGRPLGLGSVLLCLDQAEWLIVDEQGMPATHNLDVQDIRQCLHAFAEKLSNLNQPEALARHLERWVAVHRYAGLTRAEYPAVGGNIFNHHTGIRREHMKLRRKQPKDGHRDDRALEEPNLNDLKPKP
jgi:CRISPR-associated protein (TIGR03986 family)